MRKILISLALTLTMLFGSVGNVSAAGGGCSAYKKVFYNGKQYGKKYDSIECDIYHSVGLENGYFIGIKGEYFSEGVKFVLNEIENGKEKEIIRSDGRMFVYAYDKNKIIGYYKGDKPILEVNGKKYDISYLSDGQNSPVYTDMKGNYGFFIKKGEKYKAIINGKEDSKEFDSQGNYYFDEYFNPRTEQKKEFYKTERKDGITTLYLGEKKIYSTKRDVSIHSDNKTKNFYYTYNDGINQTLNINGKDIATIKYNYIDSFKVSYDTKIYGYVKEPKEDTRKFDLNTFTHIGKDTRTEEEKQHHLIINGKKVVSAKELIDFKLLHNNLGYTASYKKGDNYINDLFINGKKVSSVSDDGRFDFQVSSDGKVYGYVKKPKRNTKTEEKNYHLYVNGKKIVSSPYEIYLHMLSNEQGYYARYFKNESDKENHKGSIILNGKEIEQNGVEDIYNTQYYKIYSGEGENRIQTLMKDGKKVIENANDINVVKKESGDVEIIYKKNGKKVINVNGKNILSVNEDITPIFRGYYEDEGYFTDYSNYHYNYEKDGKTTLNINGKDIISVDGDFYHFYVNNDYTGYKYGNDENYYYNTIDGNHLNKKQEKKTTPTKTTKNITKSQLYKKIDTAIGKIFLAVDTLGKEKANQKYQEIIDRITNILKKEPNHKHKDILIYLQSKFQEKVK